MIFKLLINVVFLLLSFTLIRDAASACSSTLSVHNIVSSNNNVLTIDDEAGARDAKAMTYSVNGCNSDNSSVTGAANSFSQTWLSHANPPSGSACLQVVVSSYRVYVSFQAIVVRANSWTLKPNFTVFGVSAEEGATGSTGYKESVAIFGIRNKSLVSPLVTLNENTLLKKYSYIVPAWASRNMDLEIGAVMASGAEYAAPDYYDCDSVDATRCQLQVSFSESVDAFVVMFALAQRSQSASVSTTALSEMSLGCGCRCRVSDLGKRFVTSSAGMLDECVRKESFAPLTECDVFGDKWCDRRPNKYFEISGPARSNGNFPCIVKDNYVAEFIQDFTPVVPF